MSSLKQYAAKSLLTSSSVVFQTNNSMDWGGVICRKEGAFGALSCCFCTCFWGSQLLLILCLVEVGVGGHCCSALWRFQANTDPNGVG